MLTYSCMQTNSIVYALTRSHTASSTDALSQVQWKLVTAIYHLTPLEECLLTILNLIIFMHYCLTVLSLIPLYRDHCLSL